MERDKALDMALGQIHKNYGKGAIMRMGEQPMTQIGSIPTGALSLDLALGIGGLPRGRVIEIYGPESRLAGSRPSSMPSTPLTPTMQRHSA